MLIVSPGTFEEPPNNGGIALFSRVISPYRGKLRMGRGFLKDFMSSLAPSPPCTRAKPPNTKSGRADTVV